MDGFGIVILCFQDDVQINFGLDLNENPASCGTFILFLINGPLSYSFVSESHHTHTEKDQSKPQQDSRFG